jgi:hypothetical protein
VIGVIALVAALALTIELTMEMLRRGIRMPVSENKGLTLMVPKGDSIVAIVVTFSISATYD